MEHTSLNQAIVQLEFIARMNELERMKSYCSIFEFLNKLVSISLLFRLENVKQEVFQLFDELLLMTRLWTILKQQSYSGRYSCTHRV